MNISALPPAMLGMGSGSAATPLASRPDCFSQGAVMTAGNLVPETLLSQVVDVFDPRRAILVGSRARGDAREDSDYDLVMVLDDEVPDELLSARRRYDGARVSPRSRTSFLAARER